MPVPHTVLASSIERRLDQSGEHTCVYMWPRRGPRQKQGMIQLGTKVRDVLELEDAEHVMLRCGEYDEERRGPGPKAAEWRDGLTDASTPQEWWEWIMEGGGEEEGMQLLVDIMRKRAELMKQQGIA